jgi:flagellar basal body-associated protein FliL
MQGRRTGEAARAPPAGRPSLWVPGRRPHLASLQTSRENRPATPGPNTESDGFVKTLLAPAVTAFLAAVLGVVSTVWLDSCNEADEAENAARVLEQNFEAAEDAFKRSLIDGRYRFYELEVNPPLDDQKRIADELEEKYEPVADAASAFSLQFARAREKHDFVQDDYVQVACAMVRVGRGRHALSELTGTPPETIMRTIRGYRRSGRSETIEILAERFYSNYISGNGELACAAFDPPAARQLRNNSPDCNDTPRRGKRRRKRLESAEATVDVRTGSATLTTDDGDVVARLRLTDVDGDNVWHVVEARDVQPRSIHRPEAKKRQPGR